MRLLVLVRVCPLALTQYGGAIFFGGITNKKPRNPLGFHSITFLPFWVKGYEEKKFKTYMGGWLVGFFSKTKFFLQEKYLYNGPFCGTNF